MINLQDVIDQHLLSKQEQKKDRIRSGKISPSSMGRCFRFQYLNRKGEPGLPLDARTLRKFAVGTLFHEWIEKILPEHQKEVLVETDDIKGYADVVIDDAVIDIKSTHSFDFKRFWNKTKPYDVYTDKANYWYQVGLYGQMLQKKWVGLFFVSKDDLVTEQFIAPTEKFKDIIEQELFTLRTDWALQKIPKGMPRAFGGTECSFCCYRESCPDKVIHEKKQKPEAVKEISSI